ncbi:butyrophilin subfamily 3 member A2-like [Gambusia affinis]|uniref:butyrophilin subfamily 3 member A2-like n=1 Tax=Gambusia affinis TaxID=33528 RepID=UPI001CDC15A0|nr:butyrophilin subfamily 3 member A2-like [Gambusia affinis]
MRCFPVIFGLISFLPVADQDQFAGTDHFTKTEGKYNLTGSEGPIKAQVGSDVVLPCSVKPPDDVRDAVVEWMFNFSKTVHLFLYGDDHQESQDERYKDRTILNHTMIEHGDVSLTLAKVTKNDAGIYTCFVRRGPDLSDERIVTLVVVDEKENHDHIPISGDKNEKQVTSPATKGPDPGVNGCGVACVVGVVVSLILISITFCVVCWWKREQIFPRRNNNARNEEVRNDGGMEMEELRNHRGNGNQGNEAEAEPLQNQEEPN